MINQQENKYFSKQIITDFTDKQITDYQESFSIQSELTDSNSKGLFGPQNQNIETQIALGNNTKENINHKSNSNLQQNFKIGPYAQIKPQKYGDILYGFADLTKEYQESANFEQPIETFLTTNENGIQTSYFTNEVEKQQFIPDQAQPTNQNDQLYLSSQNEYATPSQNTVSYQDSERRVPQIGRDFQNLTNFKNFQKNLLETRNEQQKRVPSVNFSNPFEQYQQTMESEIIKLNVSQIDNSVKFEDQSQNTENLSYIPKISARSMGKTLKLKIKSSKVSENESTNLKTSNFMQLQQFYRAQRAQRRGGQSTVQQPLSYKIEEESFLKPQIITPRQQVPLLDLQSFGNELLIKSARNGNLTKSKKRVKTIKLKQSQIDKLNSQRDDIQSNYSQNVQNSLRSQISQNSKYNKNVAATEMSCQESENGSNYQKSNISLKNENIELQSETSQTRIQLKLQTPRKQLMQNYISPKSIIPITGFKQQENIQEISLNQMFQQTTNYQQNLKQSVPKIAQNKINVLFNRSSIQKRIEEFTISNQNISDENVGTLTTDDKNNNDFLQLNEISVNESQQRSISSHLEKNCDDSMTHSDKLRSIQNKYKKLVDEQNKIELEYKQVIQKRERSKMNPYERQISTSPSLERRNRHKNYKQQSSDKSNDKQNTFNTEQPKVENVNQISRCNWSQALNQPKQMQNNNIFNQEATFAYRNEENLNCQNDINNVFYNTEKLSSSNNAISDSLQLKFGISKQSSTEQLQISNKRLCSKCEKCCNITNHRQPLQQCVLDLGSLNTSAKKNQNRAQAKNKPAEHKIFNQKIVNRNLTSPISQWPAQNYYKRADLNHLNSQSPEFFIQNNESIVRRISNTISSDIGLLKSNSENHDNSIKLSDSFNNSNSNLYNNIEGQSTIKQDETYITYMSKNNHLADEFDDYGSSEERNNHFNRSGAGVLSSFPEIMDLDIVSPFQEKPVLVCDVFQPKNDSISEIDDCY